MAKVSFPLLSGEASGKFGEQVFYRRQGKTYVRKLVKPRNPNTDKQKAVRDNFTGLSNAFSGKGDAVLKKKTPTGYVNVQFPKLTAEEANMWKEYARRRGMYPSYGRNLFIAENQKRLLKFGYDPIRTPITG